MADDDRVSGEGWISDDSDFYGDAKTQKSLERSVARNKAAPALPEFHDRLPAVISFEASSGSTQNKYNPYEGKPDIAWQLNESIADFVKRLRPSRLSGSDGEVDERDGTPWIWVCNPFAEPSALRSPEELDEFISRGSKLLEKFDGTKHTIEEEQSGRTKATITKKLKPHLDELEEMLKGQAIKHGVTSGKWMLFPKVKDIDRIWRTVADAVASGRLGQCAKVATTGSPKRGQGSNTSTRQDMEDTRLICIYTKDFSNVQDVRRVLEGLMDVGLVNRTDVRGIYYKADAYTYLNIDSSNEYGLKASFYSSKIMLKDD